MNSVLNLKTGSSWLPNTVGQELPRFFACCLTKLAHNIVYFDLHSLHSLSENVCWIYKIHMLPCYLFRLCTYIVICHDIYKLHSYFH